MLKNILKSVFTIVIYYFLVFSFEKLAEFIIIKYELFELDTVYYLLIETVIFAIFISISIFIIKKTLSFNKKKVVIRYDSVFLISIIVLLLRVLEDPILRINFIIKNLPIPEPINVGQQNSLELFVIFINTVLLVSLFEELLFRKIILSFYSSKNLVFGMFLSTVLFTLIHVDFNSIDVLRLITVFVFGFIACIIYIKFGLFYSILFHIGYNLIWFLIKIDVIKYWVLLKKLNFGLIYWTLIITSFSVVTYFSYKSLKQINKKEV